MWAKPRARGMKTTSREAMVKMMLVTIPVQARNEANLVIDIPEMYLVIFQVLGAEFSWFRLVNLFPSLVIFQLTLPVQR